MQKVEQVEEIVRGLSYNQLMVLRMMLAKPSEVMTSTILAKKLPVMGKSLGAVLSAMARKDYNGEKLLLPMGMAIDGVGRRWKMNIKLLPPLLSEKLVRALILSYK